MLEAVNQSEPRLVFKGGAAFEFRFGDRARSSADIDMICRANLDHAVQTIGDALTAGWSGFEGRLIDLGSFEAPGVSVAPRRTHAKLSYRGKAFVTIPIEVAAPEGRSLECIDEVTVRPLSELGLVGPRSVPVLGSAYQIAQKIHACTTVPADGRPNDRARDLADLILLDELTEIDLSETRAACVEVFSLRSMHGWPPTLVAWPHWPMIWNAIVRNDQFPVADLDDAVTQVRSLIEQIDDAVSATKLP